MSSGVPLAVTVSSLARRLSTFFLNDVMVGDTTSAPLPPVSFTKHHTLPSVEQQDELNSKEPLLPPHSHNSLSGPTDCPSTPTDFSSCMGYGSFSSSPFVVVGETQVEVGVEADTTIDEVEEAVLLGESPLNRELSLSMLGCREGVYSPDFFPSAEERPSTPVPPLEDGRDVDHSYARPVLTCEPVQPAPVPVQEAIMPPRTADRPQSPEQEVCFHSSRKSLYWFLKPNLNVFPLCTECRRRNHYTARARSETDQEVKF